MVFKIFSPRDANTRKCIFESDLTKLAGLLKEAYLSKSNLNQSQNRKSCLPTSERQESNIFGRDLGIRGTEGGEINQVSYELLGKARELATQVNTKVGAILVGQNNPKLAKDLISFGADRVYIIASDQIDDFQPVPFSRVVCELLDKYKPQIMLFGATPLGRELAPRVAYRACSGLTADCTHWTFLITKKVNRNILPF